MKNKVIWKYLLFLDRMFYLSENITNKYALQFEIMCSNPQHELTGKCLKVMFCVTSCVQPSDTSAVTSHSSPSPLLTSVMLTKYVSKRKPRDHMHIARPLPPADNVVRYTDKTWLEPTHTVYRFYWNMGWWFLNRLRF